MEDPELQFQHGAVPDASTNTTLQNDIELCLEDLFLGPSQGIQKAFNFVLGTMKSQQSKFDTLAEEHEKLREENALLLENMKDLQGSCNGIFEYSEQHKAMFDTLEKMKFDSNNLIESVETIKTAQNGTEVDLNGLKEEVKVMAFNLQLDAGDVDNDMGKSPMDDISVETIETSQIKVQSDIENIEDSGKRQEDRTSSSQDSEEGEGTVEQCTSGSECVNDKIPARDEITASSRKSSISLSRKLMVHETLAARLNRIEQDKDSLNKELGEIKSTLNDINNGSNKDCFNQIDSMKEVICRISIVENFLSGFGIVSSDDVSEEIQGDHSPANVISESSKVRMESADDTEIEIADCSKFSVSTPTNKFGFEGTESTLNSKAENISAALSDDANGDANDSQPQTIASPNMVEGYTKQPTGLDSRQVSDDAISAYDEGVKRSQLGFSKIEGGAISASNETHNDRIERQPTSIEAAPMDTIDSKSAVLQPHRNDEHVDLEGNGRAHEGMKISPPKGQFDHSNSTIEQSELLEPDQVKEEYSPHVDKGVGDSSINGSEIKNGNPYHSVNEIGGTTVRNSIPGEKAIASIQGSERSLENYSRKQSLLLYLLEQEGRFKEKTMQILSRVVELEKQIEAKDGTKIMGSDCMKTEVASLDPKEVESDLLVFRRDLDSLHESIFKVSKDLQTKPSMNMVKKELSAYLFESKSIDDGMIVPSTSSTDFNQKDLEKFQMSIQRQLKFMNDQKVDKDIFFKDLSASKENTIILVNETIGRSEAKLEESLDNIQNEVDGCKNDIIRIEKRAFELNSLTDELNIDERIRDATMSVQSNLNEVLSSQLEGLKQVEDEMEKVASQLAEKPDQEQINTMLQNLEKSVLKHVGIDEELKSILDGVKNDLKQKLTKEQVLGLVKQLLRNAKEGITKNTASLMVGYKCLGCNETIPSGVNKFMAAKVNHNALPYGRSVPLPVYPYYHRPSLDAKMSHNKRSLAPLRRTSSATLGFRHPRLQSRPRSSPIGPHVNSNSVKGSR